MLCPAELRGREEIGNGELGCAFGFLWIECGLDCLGYLFG
jgi:hypothetical protein